MLHSKNPYNRQKTNLEELKGKFNVWNSKIITLLNHHQVQLYNEDYQLWVIMTSKDMGKCM